MCAGPGDVCVLGGTSLSVITDVIQQVSLNIVQDNLVQYMRIKWCCTDNCIRQDNWIVTVNGNAIQSNQIISYPHDSPDTNTYYYYFAVVILPAITDYVSATVYFKYTINLDKTTFSSCFRWGNTCVPGKIRIALLGDNGCGKPGPDFNTGVCYKSALAQPVIDSMYNQKIWERVDLLLHMGDIAYSGGKKDGLNQYSRMMQPISSQIPTMYVAGNHEFLSCNPPWTECGVQMVKRWPMVPIGKIIDFETYASSCIHTVNANSTCESCVDPSMFQYNFFYGPRFLAIAALNANASCSGMSVPAAAV